MDDCVDASQRFLSRERDFTITSIHRKQRLQAQRIKRTVDVFHT